MNRWFSYIACCSAKTKVKVPKPYFHRPCWIYYNRYHQSMSSELGNYTAPPLNSTSSYGLLPSQIIVAYSHPLPSDCQYWNFASRASLSVCQPTGAHWPTSTGSVHLSASCREEEYYWSFHGTPIVFAGLCQLLLCAESQTLGVRYRGSSCQRR